MVAMINYTELRARKGEGGKVLDIATSVNLYFEVELRNYSPFVSMVKNTKPEKTKGEKFRAWERSMVNVEEYWGRRPFWINVTFHGDDDLVMCKDFATLEEAEAMFVELSTCPVAPDFDALGFM